MTEVHAAGDQVVGAVSVVQTVTGVRTAGHKSTSLTTRMSYSCNMEVHHSTLSHCRKYNHICDQTRH